MGTSDIYIKKFRENMKGYYPNWKPDEEIVIGDYGILKNDYFNKLGNLKDLGIDFKTRIISKIGKETFNHNSSYSVSPKLDVEIDTLLKANVEINFINADALFMNCIYFSRTMIDSLIEIEGHILKVFNLGKWKKDFVIVYNLVESRNSIIAISGENKANLKLEMDIEDINNMDIDLSLGFKLIKNDSGSYVYLTDGNSTIVPMFRLAKLKGIFDPTISPLAGVINVTEDEYTEYQLEEID